MKAKRKTAEKAKAPRFSRTHVPEGVEPIEWQRALRLQFGSEQEFRLENQGTDSFFSEFRIGNPEENSHYRVAIRGRSVGENFCSCLDFATNELGTCKHIEFTLARLMRKRGAKAAFARGYHAVFSELWLRYGRQRTVHFRAGVECPAAVAKIAAGLFDASLDGQLPEARFGKLSAFLARAARSGHEVRAYADALDFIAGRRDASRRIAELDRLFPRGASDPSIKKLLKSPLYPYQVEGALFAVRAGRSLIGDEMGLGKTIQAIAAAEILARHFGVSKVLVVCPTSLKYQWQSEIHRFSERRARVITGGRSQRSAQYIEDDFCKIVNYEKLKSDHDLITAWGADLVIVDEAQRIKNWNTIAAKALKRINSAYAIVLSGTPLENKLEELISIVQFVDQHRLGPTWKLLHEHQIKDEAGRVTGYTGLERIGLSLAPIMIRRRKSEVLLQLPGRTEQNLLVPMTERQMALHEENADLVRRIVQRWRKRKFLSDLDQRQLNCALQNMRMSCNSTYLLDKKTDHGVKVDELLTLLEGLFVQPDAKVVVFSQWTGTHEIIIRRLKQRGIGYVSFHGGVPSESRPSLVQQFREDANCRVFLSTDAGSTGLNLQSAATLVNMDLPWNPAVLEQRAARIYRMGQKRPVQIISYISKGTIEEGMVSRLAFKRSLSAGILDGATGEVSLGGSRLSQFMKDVEDLTLNLPESEPMTAADEDEINISKSSADSETSIDASDLRPEAPSAEKTRSTSPVPGERGEESRREIESDPWSGLVQFGLGLVSALTAPNDDGTAAHPWVERNPTTGARSLRVPLPPPDQVRKLADALLAFSGALTPRKGV